MASCACLLSSVYCRLNSGEMEMSITRKTVCAAVLTSRITFTSLLLLIALPRTSELVAGYITKFVSSRASATLDLSN